MYIEIVINWRYTSTQFLPYSRPLRKCAGGRISIEFFRY